MLLRHVFVPFFSHMMLLRSPRSSQYGFYMFHERDPSMLHPQPIVARLLPERSAQFKEMRSQE